LLSGEMLIYLYSIVSFLFFFFSSRRQHTISKRDWSSDVCSSDLHLNQLHRAKLVSICQAGNTKYFSINRDEIKKVLGVLEGFFNIEGMFLTKTIWTIEEVIMDDAF